MSGKATDESGTISAGTNRRIQKRAAKGALKEAPKHVGFTKERRKIFLSHFAATCNATASAAAAGVSPRTIYNWRRDNAEFRAAWGEALDQGYARLEAELVRSSTESLTVPADEEAAAFARVGTVDAKTALAVLLAYRRQVAGAQTGEIIAQPYDMEAVRRRLEAKMRALGIIPPSPEATADKPLLLEASPLPDQGGEGEGGDGKASTASSALGPDGSSGAQTRAPTPKPLPAREGRA